MYEQHEPFGSAWEVVVGGLMIVASAPLWAPALAIRSLVRRLRGGEAW